MEEFIINIANSLVSFFHSKFLAVLFTSMLPIVEVRGGIPLALNLNMTPVQSYFSACLAGVIIVPIILLFLKKVIYFISKSDKFGKFGKSLNNYFYERAQKVENGAIVKKSKNIILKYLALFLFVAIPLPLTGFWTGTAIAVFMNLDTLKSFITIMIGNFTAGGLILLISLVLHDQSYIIFVIFVAFVPIVLALLIYKLIKKKKSVTVTNDNTESDNNYTTK